MHLICISLPCIEGATMETDHENKSKHNKVYTCFSVWVQLLDNIIIILLLSLFYYYYYFNKQCRRFSRMSDGQHVYMHQIQNKMHEVFFFCIFTVKGSCNDLQHQILILTSLTLKYWSLNTSKGKSLTKKSLSKYIWDEFLVVSEPKEMLAWFNGLVSLDITDFTQLRSPGVMIEIAEPDPKSPNPMSCIFHIYLTFMYAGSPFSSILAPTPCCWGRDIFHFSLSHSVVDDKVANFFCENHAAGAVQYIWIISIFFLAIHFLRAAHNWPILEKHINPMMDVSVLKALSVQWILVIKTGFQNSERLQARPEDV